MADDGMERLPLLSPAAATNAIEVRGLSHSFGTVRVMNDLSMTVARGTPQHVAMFSQQINSPIVAGSIFGTITSRL